MQSTHHTIYISYMYKHNTQKQMKNQENKLTNSKLAKLCYKNYTILFSCTTLKATNINKISDDTAEVKLILHTWNLSTLLLKCSLLTAM